MAYVLEEGCLCILLVVMLGGLLFTAVSLALIAPEILRIAVRRVYSWAVNSTRGQLLSSMRVIVDREHAGHH